MAERRRLSKTTTDAGTPAASDEQSFAAGPDAT
jgi:hypothetical protein